MVSPVREDELLQATFTGKPGDRVWIVYSMVPGSGLASARWDGRLVLGSPRAGFFVGTIDGSGSLVFQTAAPDLPSGVESAIFFLQGLFRDTGTRRFVTSAPSAMVLLDSAF